MQNSREMTKLAVTALEDKKAENIKIINIETVSTLADRKSTRLNSSH